MYYATDIAAIMYNSNATANNFVLWDKSKSQEVSIITDEAWDVTSLDWVRKYDATEQPDAAEVFSDAFMISIFG